MARRRNSDDDDLPVPINGNDDDDDDETVELDEPEVRYVRPRRVSAAERGDDNDEQVIPDRVLRIPLPPPWAHLRIYGWFDYPKEVADRMSPVEGETAEEASERVMEVLREVITQHDGWKDRDRNELAQPSSPAFWNAIPNPLATAIIRSYFGLVKRNPTQRASKAKTKRR